jgi:hypothetical protein
MTLSEKWYTRHILSSWVCRQTQLIYHEAGISSFQDFKMIIRSSQIRNLPVVFDENHQKNLGEANCTRN